MDLPCPDWIKHAEQIWSRLDPDQKKMFSTQFDIEEMLDFGQSHTTPDDVQVLFDLGRTTPVQKCAQSALTLRERGNGSFKKKDYTSAALHYTQGVCHAPGDSEQLALCYANRSAALFYLRRYQECLEDISRALEHGYPSHLLPKLLSRRAQCQACLPSHQPGQDGASTTLHSPTLTPTSTPSSNSRPETQGSQPHASSPLMGLSLRFRPEKGRHLVVVEGRRAGEVILEDQAFSCVLIPGEGLRGGQEQGDDGEVGRKGAGGAKKETFGTEERCCHRCLRPSLCLVPCPGCSYSRYCSRPCQQQAWKEHHRWECPLGAELRAAGVLAQLALRVALKAGLQRVQRARDTQQQRETRRQSDQEVLEESKDDIGRGNTSGPHTQEVRGNGKDSIGKGNTCGTDTTTSPPACVQAESSALPAHEPTMTFDPSMGCHGDTYQRVYSLLPHVDGHPASLRFLYAVTMATLFQALRQAGPPPPIWGGRECNMSDSCSDQSAGEDGVCDAWKPELSMLGVTALRHLLQLRANAQAIITERVADNGSDAAVQASQEVRVGTAIFPTLSLLNHACRPNTSLTFDPCCRGNSSEGTSPHLVSSPDSSVTSVTGVSVTVRASRDLRDGEELLHCYGPHCSRMEVQERQRLLLDQYMFTCQCEACLQDLQSPAEGLSAKTHYKCPKCAKALQAKAGVYVCVHKGCSGQVTREQLEFILRTLKALLDQALELLDMDQPDEALPFLHEAMNKARRHLLDTHRLHGQLSDASARAYASMGMWSEAASHLRVSVECVRGQFGEDSVELGQQLFKLTQLHFNGGQAGPALCVLAEARRVLSLHRHTHSEELQELQAMEDCLRGSR